MEIIKNIKLKPKTIIPYADIPVNGGIKIPVPSGKDKSIFQRQVKTNVNHWVKYHDLNWKFVTSQDGNKIIVKRVK